MGAFDSDYNPFGYDVEVSAYLDAYDVLEEGVRADQWGATLRLATEDGEQQPVAARARFTVIREARHESAVWDLLDEISGDHEAVGSALCLRDGVIDDDAFQEVDALLGFDLMVVDHVHVKRAHRGHGLSHRLVDVAVKALGVHGLVALHAMPTRGPRKPEHVEALQRHWEAGGFQHWRDGVYIRGAEN